MLKHVREAAANLLPKNKFARSVSVLAGGTAIGQIIIVAFSPILTRLYSPEDFGVFAVYSALLAVFSCVGSLRYNAAIPLPVVDAQALKIVSLCFLANISTTLLIAALVFLYGEFLAEAFNAPELKSYLWLLPIGHFFTVLHQMFLFWATRKKTFQRVSKTQLSQACSLVGVQIALSPFGPIALLLGNLISNIVAIVALTRSTPLIKTLNLKQSGIDRKSIFVLAKKYRAFPFFGIWATLSNTIAGQLPLMILAAYFSPALAGYYLIAHRVLAKPVSVLGRAIAQVFISSSAKLYRDKNLASTTEYLYKVLIPLAIPPTILLMAMGPQAFRLIFGPSWEFAGEIARWLAPWCFFLFITSPLGSIFVVIGKQKANAIFQFSFMVFGSIGLLIGAYQENIMFSIGSFVIINVLGRISLIYYLLRNLGVSFKKVCINIFFKYLIIVVLMLSPFIVMVLNFGDSGVPVLILGMVYVLTVITLYYVKLGKSISYG